jgi:hypothetical protein
MADVTANPAECTTPEAWAELVRGERVSTLQAITERQAAEAQVAQLREENGRLLMALLSVNPNVPKSET